MKKLLLMLALVGATSLVAFAHEDGKGKKSCCSKESSKSATLAPGAEKKSCCSKKDSKAKAETKKTSDAAATKEAAPKK